MTEAAAATSPRPAATLARFYHPELDTLRFGAFLLVFLHHALPLEAASYVALGLPGELAAWLAGAARSGGFGVDLFFALSAYLITEILRRELTVTGRIDLRAFYLRRGLRIWPLYFFFLALTVFVVPLLLPAEHLPASYLPAFLGFVANWAIALHGYPPSVAAPLWSVSIEEQFYLVWPLLMLWVGLRRPLGLGGVALGMLAVSTAARAFLVARGAEHPALWTNTLTRLDPIAFGVLLAVVLRGRAPALSSGVRVALVGAGLAAWIVASRYGDVAGPSALVTYPVVGLASVAMLAGTLRPATARGAPTEWTAHPALTYLGRISYGLYVYHVLAISLAARPDAPAVLAGPIVRIPAAFLVTLACAAASYRFLEAPFLRLKQRYTQVPSR
jgi:peptidoglycan/LPS O-acetylase OafA/YrhL